MTRSRIALAAMTIARLGLAIGMIPYAVSKLCNIQFQVRAWDYARPLGEIPGTILTWAFLGYSPTFQFLLGLFEFVPSVMLLFARTRKLGAFLMFPVLLNVVLINYFLDLWPQTLKISSVMLAANLFLLAYDYKMYLGFLETILQKPTPSIEHPRLRLAAKLASFAIPVITIGLFLADFRTQVKPQLDHLSDFLGHRQINRSGTWKIDSLNVAGKPMPQAPNASLYFDFGGRCTYSDGTRRDIGTFWADHANQTFNLAGIPIDGRGGDIEGTYKIDGNRLLLEGHGSAGVISLIMHRTWR